MVIMRKRHKKIFLRLLLVILAILSADNAFAIAEDDYSAYLFTYFTGNGPGEEQIRFAVSQDGFNYKALNDNKPVILSKDISSSGGVRDPHILRCNGGKTFYMVVTDLYVPEMGWSNFALILMKSTDLINWESSIINIPKVYPDQFGKVYRVWAPQTIYDQEKDKYMVYFSMKEGNDPDKIYYAYANDDFTGFEAAPKQLYYPPAESNNRACIDGDIIYKDGKYYLFHKAEDGSPGIKLAISDKLTEGYKLYSNKRMDCSDRPVEGSGIFKLNHSDEWILMYDMYTSGRYQFTRSSDLLNFEVIDKDISMDFHPRHGTVMPITDTEYMRLVSKWGSVKNLFVEPTSDAIKKLNINIDGNNYHLPVKSGTDLSGFDPVFVVGDGVKISPNGPQDFTNGPVKYTLGLKGQKNIDFTVSASVWHNPALDGYYADPDIIYSNKTGKYYIYPTSDGFDGWSGTYFKTFSSDNLVDWVDEGVILDLHKDVSWADRNAWAPCIIERKIDGKYKYFYYFTAAQKIGVAVADDPAGPFVDSGKPLISSHPAGINRGQEIDPDVFCDPQTGKYYLYWGNGYLAVAELNDDMVSFKGDIKIMTPNGTFREGAHVLYRNGKYYFLWSENDTRSQDYRVRYAMADSPLGPLEIPRDNMVIAKDPSQGIYGTGHNSTIQVPGVDEWYIVYHRFTYPQGIKMGRSAGFHRETCIDKLEFDESGKIIRCKPTLAGIAPVSKVKVSSSIKEFPLDQVKILDGPFKHAQDVNLKHLLKYDVDRLLAPYLKEAGLQPKAESYPNWIGLDGHVGGHYLSAMSIYYASTGSKECKRRMEYMLDELDKCQIANGNGYVGGVPGSSKLWEKVAAGDPMATHKSWVPWYNIHKTYNGLRDAWMFAKNKKAKSMLIKFADWAVELLKDFTPDMMERMMDQEYGGMNEVLADVAAITGDPKYLELAKRFSHRQLLTPMSQGVDSLDNKHANTQVPKAIGFERIAELGGEELYDKAASFFWQTVVDNRTLAFGGNSRREHFPAASSCMEMIEEREGPESCNTHNMLKLSEGLFRMHHDVKYVDYYERALFNHILSTQHPDHGGYVYFTPARPRHYRVYSAPNEGMWCCVGTGMENHGQYGRFIYCYDEDSLYGNLFIASQLDWKDKGVTITQETSFPDTASTAFKISVDKPTHFALKIRHPEWLPAGQLQFAMGSKVWTADSEPSSYAVIDRYWLDGDELQVFLPMSIRTEPMPNVPEYVAVLYGPIVLAAKTGTEDLKGLVADDSRWAHIAHGELLPLSEAPVFIDDGTPIQSKIVNISDQSGLKFKTENLIKPDKYKDLILEPFYQIHDARYSMCWKMLSQQDYQRYLEEEKVKEQERLLLDKLTIDRVIPGEQQPESDHFMKTSGSESGNYKNKSLRHAKAPDWFSYDLKVEPNEKLSLMVTYWGNERGRRTFDIIIDGEKLVTENTVGKWKREALVDVKYPIPASFIIGKSKINVKFNPHPGNYAGGIFDLRIIKQN